MRKRVFMPVSIAFLLMGILSGCMMNHEDPEELLSQAVSSIVGQDDFTFVGSTSKRISGGSIERAYTFTGSVSGHNDIYIEPMDTEDRSANDEFYANSGMIHYSKVNKKWVMNGGDSKQLHPLYSLNPLIHAEYLNRKAQDVSIVADQSTNDVTILQAVVEEEEQLMASMQQHIREEHEQVIAAAQQELARHSNNTQLQEELTNYLAKAEQRLEEMLNSLQIEANYRLAVANRSRQLNSLEVITQLQYDIEGEQRMEQIDTVYQFR